MKQKLAAVVKYDLYPYALVHDIDRLESGGGVHVPNIGSFVGKCVIAVVPADEGQKIRDTLTEIRNEVNEIHVAAKNAGIKRLLTEFPHLKTHKEAFR